MDDLTPEELDNYERGMIPSSRIPQQKYEDNYVNFPKQFLTDIKNRKLNSKMLLVLMYLWNRANWSAGRAQDVSAANIIGTMWDKHEKYIPTARSVQEYLWRLHQCGYIQSRHVLGQKGVYDVILNNYSAVIKKADGTYLNRLLRPTVTRDWHELPKFRSDLGIDWSSSGSSGGSSTGSSGASSGESSGESSAHTTDSILSLETTDSIGVGSKAVEGEAALPRPPAAALASLSQSTAKHEQHQEQLQPNHLAMIRRTNLNGCRRLANQRVLPVTAKPRRRPSPPTRQQSRLPTGRHPVLPTMPRPSRTTLKTG